MCRQHQRRPDLRTDVAVKDPQHDAYPGLDTLRAVASICVLATHTAFWTGQYGKGFLGAASSRLDVGVAIFFVLSGFLLGRPFMVAMARGTSQPPSGRYFWKRGLRILPVYWIAVAVALITLSDNQDAGVWDWVKSLTLTDLYVDAGLPAGLTQMWSLATEAAFYIILPALMWAFAHTTCRSGWNPRRIMYALTGLVGLNVLWLITIAPHRAGAGQWLPAYFSWFAAGLVFAVLVVEKRQNPSNRLVLAFDELGRHPLTCWVMALALFAAATTPIAGPTLLVPPTHGEAVTKNLVYALIAGLIMLPSIFGPKSGTAYATLLGSRVLRHLGLISYGIFCVHLVIIHAVADWRDLPLFQGGGWELFILTLVFSLIASELLYRLVEKPMMRLRNLRIGSSNTVDTAAASENTTAN